MEPGSFQEHPWSTLKLLEKRPDLGSNLKQVLDYSKQLRIQIIKVVNQSVKVSLGLTVIVKSTTLGGAVSAF